MKNRSLERIEGTGYVNSIRSGVKPVGLNNMIDGKSCLIHNLNNHIQHPGSGSCVTLADTLSFSCFYHTDGNTFLTGTTGICF
ncbi:MAG: hypothetical protein EA360_01985 [Balneolaceae bacterium]|nr:MAG: hypothetical protein EA360_01985 [Balneolaceae bacterium]